MKYEFPTMKYWLTISVAMNLFLIGAVMNMTVVSYNEGRMPVYSSDFFQSDNTHFTFNNPSEVNMPYLADIFNFQGWIYYSVGDILLIGIMLFYLGYAIYLTYQWRKRK